ncbi:hypothetical protein CC80DRAFT_121079 [Byssothecium circinans]|uniref:Zn(2)-C6 fungal-type domain-containing protein n=1 Tax=Byssothecium circinans TaxID=147558 RepID=A0A6A5TV72_9PLEO|nr:hypothetical protein CC80DRAFT_121079 [Byssothecium circinans]
MFTAFICNEPATEPAKDREHISPPNVASSFSTGQFSRTACDICRAKNLKCRGAGDSCDGCIASSSACTYTFSSGVGLGKKRRRKVWSPSLNVSISQQRPISPPSSSSQEYEGGPQTRNARSEQRSNEWNYLQDMPDVAVVTPAELIRDDTNTVNSHSTPRASDNDWSDVSLSGDGFVLCPGKHISPVTHPASQLRSLLHSQPEPESALRSNATSPLDPEILQMFEMPLPQMRGDPPTTRTSRQSSFGQNILPSGALDLTPPFTPRPPLSDSSGVRQDNTSTTQDKAFGRSYGLSSRCDCHASISQILDEFDLQRSSDIKVVPTDALFLSVEKGIDQFSTIHFCNKCNVNDVNPMLVINNVNLLALRLFEIVHRLTHCQSPDSAPIIFRFGGYSVQNTKMRTSLLAGMIGLHVRCLNQLITRLENNIADQPRLLLAGARSIVTKMQQTLEALPSGSHTDYDS